MEKVTEFTGECEYIIMNPLRPGSRTGAPLPKGEGPPSLGRAAGRCRAHVRHLGHCFNLSITLRRRSGEMSERHGSLSKQEIEKTHDFRLLSEEYGRRYGL